MIRFLKEKVLPAVRPIVAVTFGLQSLRLVLPGFTFYLREVRGLNSLTLAPIAILIFSLTFVSVILTRQGIIVPGLRMTLMLLGSVRIFEVISTNPAIDLILSAAGVVLFGIYLPLETRRRIAFGQGKTALFCFSLLLGFAFDAGLFGALVTLDLSWQAGPGPILTVFFLTLVLLMPGRDDLELAAGRFSQRGYKAYWPFLAVGPWIFLQLQVLQNFGMAGSLTGWSFPSVSGWLWTCNLAGLLVAVVIPQVPSHARRLVLIGLAGVLIWVMGVGLEAENWRAALLLLLGQAAAAGLLMGIFSLGLQEEPSVRLENRLPAYLSLGLVLLVMLFFLYYASFDLSLGFRGNQLLPWVAVLVGWASIAAAKPKSSPPSRTFDLQAVWPHLILLIFPIYLMLTWPDIDPDQTVRETEVIRIMTYNLHQGFNPVGILDMEALARIVENQDPDIVAFQEVTRGWVINGSLDMLPWLSRKLGLPYIWGPTDPPQWGNAILSRYPIMDVEVYALPPGDLNLRRGYIDLTVKIHEDPIRVLATHLHHPLDGSPVRLVQATALIEGWGKTPHTILLGDLNASVDAPEMVALSQAGLVESLRTMTDIPPGTFPAENPTDQIDYIWVTPDLLPVAFTVPRSTASDHLPVVVDLKVIRP